MNRRGTSIKHRAFPVIEVHLGLSSWTVALLFEIHDWEAVAWLLMVGQKNSVVVGIKTRTEFKEDEDTVLTRSPMRKGEWWQEISTYWGIPQATTYLTSMKKNGGEGVRMSISIVIVSCSETFRFRLEIWCIATPRHNHDCEYGSWSPVWNWSTVAVPETVQPLTVIIIIIAADMKITWDRNKKVRMHTTGPEMEINFFKIRIISSICEGLRSEINTTTSAVNTECHERHVLSEYVHLHLWLCLLPILSCPQKIFSLIVKSLSLPLCFCFPLVLSITLLFCHSYVSLKWLKEWERGKELQIVGGKGMEIEKREGMRVCGGG